MNEFYLVYKNKESGEVKKFKRDQNRNYLAEDGTTMTKMTSWTKWSFIGKDTGKDGAPVLKRKSVPRNYFYSARQKRDSLIRAYEVSETETLAAFIDGFNECLDIFEGVK